MLTLGNVVIFSLCFLYSVNLAVSTKCYECKSGLDEDCVSNFKKNKFIRTCSSDSQHFTGDLNINYTVNPERRDESGFSCAKVKLKLTVNSKTTSTMARGCNPSSLTCEYIKANIPANAVLESCEICNGDLCNSSSKIKAGLYGLIISLMMLFAFWR